MHVPNPLGGYPLVLRDNNVNNPHNGELLFDYVNNDLYYINRNTGIKTGIADSIYKSLIAAKLENSFINIVKNEDDQTSAEPTIPEIEDRKMNNWYMNITSRTERGI